VLGGLNLSINSPQGLAIDKMLQGVITCAAILALVKLTGWDLGSVYIKRGNLRWGLSFGGLVFFNFATSAFLFFAARFTDVSLLGAAAVWGLVFAFVNGFLEELWLRGIFMKWLQPLIGVGGAVLLTALVFAFMHAGATYLTPMALPFMLANTLTLGLACGYLLVKSNSIWGPTLIHAAADYFLFIAILAPA
jgi:membrane protease YdiL (CAAX protease family)